MTVKLSPSILTADFGRLHDEIESVAPLVDQFHLDVMDGHYVPNITFGPDIVAAVRRATDLPLNVHVMITDPELFAPRFAEAGATRLSFHPEVVADVPTAIEQVRDLGMGVGLAVHPDVGLDPVRNHLGAIDVLLMMTVRPGFGGQKFMDEVVPSIAEARQLVDRLGKKVDIEVDGGVNLVTMDRSVQAGADILVAGSAIFDGGDAPAAARRLRARLRELTEVPG